MNPAVTKAINDLKTLQGYDIEYSYDKDPDVFYFRVRKVGGVRIQF
jgi:hypothetical protein